MISVLKYFFIFSFLAPLFPGNAESLLNPSLEVDESKSPGEEDRLKQVTKDVFLSYELVERFCTQRLQNHKEGQKEGERKKILEAASARSLACQLKDEKKLKEIDRYLEKKGISHFCRKYFSHTREPEKLKELDQKIESKFPGLDLRDVIHDLLKEGYGKPLSFKEKIGETASYLREGLGSFATQTIHAAGKGMSHGIFSHSNFIKGIILNRKVEALNYKEPSPLFRIFRSAKKYKSFSKLFYKTYRKKVNRSIKSAFPFVEREDKNLIWLNKDETFIRWGSVISEFILKDIYLGKINEENQHKIKKIFKKEIIKNLAILRLSLKDIDEIENKENCKIKSTPLEKAFLSLTGEWMEILNSPLQKTSKKVHRLMHPDREKNEEIKPLKEEIFKAYTSIKGALEKIIALKSVAPAQSDRRAAESCAYLLPPEGEPNEVPSAPQSAVGADEVYGNSQSSSDPSKEKPAFPTLRGANQGKETPPNKEEILRMKLARAIAARVFLSGGKSVLEYWFNSLFKLESKVTGGVGSHRLSRKLSHKLAYNGAYLFLEKGAQKEFGEWWENPRVGSRKAWGSMSAKNFKEFGCDVAFASMLHATYSLFYSGLVKIAKWIR
jgi:hypothetical protein